MNKFALLCSVSALSLASAMSAAQAQDALESDNPFYVSLFAGASIAQEADFANTNYVGYVFEQEYSTGFVLGGTIGMQVYENWRVEAEISHSRNDSDKATIALRGITRPGGLDLDTTYALANVWYDFKSDSAWSPYIGGGVGLARVSVDATDVSSSGDDTVFAYQLGGGVSYDLTDQVSLDLGYRFKGAVDPKFDFGGIAIVEADNIQTHNVQAAIRFKF